MLGDQYRAETIYLHEGCVYVFMAHFSDNTAPV